MARTSRAERRRGPASPPRVIHVVATGSGADWMVRMLLGLRARGYEVGAVIATADGDLAPKLAGAGIPFWISDTRISNPWDLAALSRKALQLTSLLRRLEPTIVHYHLFNSVIVGRVASWLAGVPARFSMITGPIYLEAPAPRAVDLQTLWMDTVVIASCSWVRKEYERLGVRKPVELIYYGVDVQRFDPTRVSGLSIRREFGLDPDVPLVGMVAHFYPPLPPGPWTPRALWGRGVKGHETLLEAVPLVLAEIPRAKFLLVGHGWGEQGKHYEARLRRWVADRGLDKVVIFTGLRSDVPEVLAALDVAVQCSLSENLGGTIEALLMGVPMVATAVGGMVDAVIDGETGLVVPPDDPVALARAVRTLLLDRGLAAHLGRRGREWALQNFTLDRTVEDLDLLYRRALRQSPSPPPCLLRLATLAARSLGPVARILWISALTALYRRGHQLLAFLSRAWRTLYWWVQGLLAGLSSRRRCLGLWAKRGIDVVLAATLLVSFSPVMLGVAAIIWLTMGRPVLFAQVRAGVHGRPFVLWKFRSMTMDVDAEGRPLPDDRRLTPVGRLLRRTSLDELPQLINVLRGEMSFVGPRPLPVEYLSLFTPEQAERFRMRPGITGWALIHGRNLLSWEERLRLDVWYVRNWTLWLDLRILLLTVWKVLTQEGVSQPGHPTMPPFERTEL